MSISESNYNIVKDYCDSNSQIRNQLEPIDKWKLGEMIEAPSLLFRIVRVFARFKEYFPKQLQSWYLKQVGAVIRGYNDETQTRLPNEIKTACPDTLLDDLKGSPEKMSQKLVEVHPAFNTNVASQQNDLKTQITKIKRFIRIYDEIQLIGCRHVDFTVAKISLEDVANKDHGDQCVSAFFTDSRTNINTDDFLCLLNLSPIDQGSNLRWLHDIILRKSYCKSFHSNTNIGLLLKGLYSSLNQEKDVLELRYQLPFLANSSDSSGVWTCHYSKVHNNQFDEGDENAMYESLYQRISQTCDLNESKLPKNLGHFIDTLRSIVDSNYGSFSDVDLSVRDWILLSDRLKVIDYLNLDECAFDLCMQIKNKKPEYSFFQDSDLEIVKIKIGDNHLVELPKILSKRRSKIVTTAFSSAMKESSEQTFNINVEGEDADIKLICEQILEFLRNGSYEEKGNLIAILKIAHMYGLKGLLAHCFHSATQNLSCENVEVVLGTAVTISHSQLICDCISYIQEHREEWENREIALIDRSQYTNLVDSIALLPDYGFRFLCAPKNGMALHVNSLYQLPGHILKALEVVSKHINVLELYFKNVNIDFAKQIIKQFPMCSFLDISQIKQGVIYFYEWESLGCKQITELIVSHSSFNKRFLDLLLKIFPNLEGFGNTSPTFLPEEIELDEYLSYFDSSTDSKEKKKKPRLLALNLRGFGYKKNVGSKLIFKEIKKTQQKIIDWVKPHLPHLYYLKIIRNCAVDSINAPRARNIYIKECENLKISNVNVPNAALWIGTDEN